MGRNPNGRSTIYKGADGKWHGRVTMGLRDDGRPDRRHVERKTKAEVLARIRDLEKQRDNGTARRPGPGWTVAAWLRHWLHNIAAPGLRDSSFSAYEVAVRKHLVPGIGAHKLERLEPEHLERLYARMIATGSRPATAHQAHRTARAALGEAVRRGHIARNPAAVARAPRLADDEVEPYTVEEVQRILREAGKERNSARWAVALALGLRQGEVLGLKWPDVDLDRGVLRVRRGRVRPKYQHGCGGRCGRVHAGYCPERVQLRPAAADTKSRASRRTIGLPDELIALLREHRAAQDQERKVARQLWHEGDWVFASPTGQPLNPNTDYHHWKSLLRRAKVREARLHDARHTAATVLLVLGVPERAVMGVMGWSTSAMAARYQHITDPVRRDVAQRLGGLLWDAAAPPGTRNETETETEAE